MKKPLLALGIFILFSISNVMAADTNDFITVWQPVSSDYYAIKLPMVGGPYDVDWENDGTFDDFGVSGTRSHVYWAPGPYTVRVRGVYTSFNTSADELNAAKLLNVTQWGTQYWRSMQAAFYKAVNLTLTATDTPDFAGVVNMTAMFADATLANPDTSGWNTSTVTDMRRMFSGATKANPNTINWNTSAVTNMSDMFADATLASPDTSNWNTSAVTDMRRMFSNTTKANPNTINWNTSAVTSMDGMFYRASSANPNTSNWNTSAVTSMYGMFFQATKANPVTSSWDTSAVMDMDQMFYRATSANPDVSSWDVSSLQYASHMFTDATSFTTTNYDKLLIGWGAQTLKNGVTLGVGSTTYCSADAINARTVMTATYSWTITDGGECGLNTNIRINLEEPSLGAPSSGVSNLRGWAVAPNGIDHIELFFDGVYIDDIPYGSIRTDVGNAFPAIPDSENSGFSMAWAYSVLNYGSNHITIVAYDNLGNYNLTKTDFQVERFTSSFISNPNHVDLRTATNMRALDNNTLIIEDVTVEGRKWDVELKWQTASQGFDIDSINVGTSASTASISYDVIGVESLEEETSQSIATVDNKATHELTSTEPIVGLDANIRINLEEPSLGAPSSGVSNLRGWAVAPNGIDHVELFFDGIYVDDIPYGSIRTDVGNAFPAIPDSENSGFSMAWAYSVLDYGSNHITIVAYDSLGNYNLAKTDFQVEKFISSFISNPNQVDLRTATDMRALDNNTLIIEDVTVEGRKWDVKLKWQTASQGFDIESINSSD